jgi:hypothetical protein
MKLRKNISAETDNIMNSAKPEGLEEQEGFCKKVLQNCLS